MNREIPIYAVMQRRTNKDDLVSCLFTDEEKAFEVCESKNSDSSAGSRWWVKAYCANSDFFYDESEPREVIDSEAITMAAVEVHRNATDHGWWDGEERTFGDIIALCHAELSEALEEHRNGHEPTEVYENPDKPGKLEGIPIELADTVIRIFDYCGRNGIDIGDAIARKHEYNKSRPYKHGGKMI